MNHKTQLTVLHLPMADSLVTAGTMPRLAVFAASPRRTAGTTGPGVCAEANVKDRSWDVIGLLLFSHFFRGVFCECVCV